MVTLHKDAQGCRMTPGFIPDNASRSLSFPLCPCWAKWGKHGGTLGYVHPLAQGGQARTAVKRKSFLTSNVSKDTPLQSHISLVPDKSSPFFS